MKIRYYIEITPEADTPVCVTQQAEDGAVVVLITAQTPEEVRQLIKGVLFR